MENMRKATFTLLFIMAFIVSGCAVTALPTQPPVDTSTSIFPTLTPSPLRTATKPPATLTLTPEPDLRTKGPFLGYFRQVPSPYAFQFVLMDVDGVGRKIIDLPDDITDTSPIGSRNISPDGKWLAFYTGTAGKYGEMPAQGQSDLTLNLLNLATGEKQVITPLLSKDYPNNFVEAVKEINDPNIRAEDLQFAFLGGITQALSWSPNGKYLAFASQLDGLSSDLYVNDMTTKKVQRLSNENEQLQSIDWSPDGKWILHGGRSSSIDEWVEYSLGVVAEDNSSVRDLGYGFAGDWLNSHEFLEYRFGIETYQLQLVDVDTGKITEIWKGYFNGYKVDPTGNWVVLYALSSAIPPEQELPGFVYGSTQLINLRSLERIQNPDPVLDPPDMFLYIKEGKVIDLPGRIEMILASPDTNYWAVAIQQDIKIYTQDLTLITEISIPLQDVKLNEGQWRPDDMLWSPDSSRLFLVYGTNIYSIDIFNGDIKLVETNLTNGYRWINGQ
jgi:Tol biopolymer transport system component